jgi:hypothetical protein
LEDTERRLEEERAARKKLEDNQDAKIKEIETSWSAVLTEKTDNWTAKEKSLEEKVENQERLIKELKASYEVSQRLGQTDESGNQSQGGATAAELELVSSELEKTSLRLAEMEGRNEQLRLELAQAVSHSKEERTTSIDDDPAYLRLQSENSSLLRKLDAARFDRESERHTWEAKFLQSERQFSKVNAEKEELKTRLEKVADYEDIRRELEMIKVFPICILGSRNLIVGSLLNSQLVTTKRPVISTMVPMALQTRLKRAVKTAPWNSYCWRETRSSPTSLLFCGYRTVIYKVSLRVSARIFLLRKRNWRNRKTSLPP